MNYFFKKYYFLFFLVLTICLWSVFSVTGRAMVSSRDELSSSGPGLSSSHSIRFGLSDSIPASGRVDIILPGDFTFPQDFDYADVDLAVSFSANGFYLDRDLIDFPDPNIDYVSIATGTDQNIISITLNSIDGIPSGRYVSVELGTNANHNTLGTSTNILNPMVVGGRNIEIKTYDDTGVYLEGTEMSVFIITPVTMSNHVTKKRSGAAPVGWLGYGTAQTILSLYTNFKAVCRYSTASNTPFSLMTDEFSYLSSTTDFYYHTKLISGLASGGTYNFFVRCRDEFGLSDDATECRYSVASTSPFQDADGNPLLNVDCVDYPIMFRISSIAGSTGDDSGSKGDEGTSGTKPGSGSSGGGGGGGQGSLKGEEKTKGKYLPYPPPLGSSGVAFKGWSYPAVDVHIVRDGTEEGYTTANAVGSFAAFLETLNRGIYTFGVWAKDSESRKSPSYTSTFWIEAGTKTEVIDIIIPPTIEIITKEISGAGFFSLLGQGVPSSLVEISVYPKKEGVKDADIVKKEIMTDAIGKWQIQISAVGLTTGTYQIKARTKVTNVGYSGFSSIVEGSIDAPLDTETPKTDNSLCAGADLNGDGKVNITDFSILMYHWNGSDACADQNKNGKVDLADFSIMMYNWTG